MVAFETASLPGPDGPRGQGRQAPTRRTAPELEAMVHLAIGPCIGACCFGCFKEASRSAQVFVEWYISSFGADVENSEITSPANSGMLISRESGSDPKVGAKLGLRI